MSLDFRCEVCGARIRQPCTNTLNPDQPLPGGRTEHFARALAPNDTERRRKAET